MYARCIPIQARDPAPKGWKAFFASPDTSSLTQREGRYLDGHVSECTKALDVNLDLLKRFGEEIRVSVDGVRLCANECATRDRKATQDNTFGRCNSRKS